MDSRRDTMMGELARGGAGRQHAGDASAKTVLVRGCDPIMAERATKLLPPMIGNARVSSATDDDAFFSLLANHQFDVVMFAPGACRHDAAQSPIPGGNAATRGWTLEDYRAKVRATQIGVPIVETTEERQIVARLRAALDLDHAC